MEFSKIVRLLIFVLVVAPVLVIILFPVNVQSNNLSVVLSISTFLFGIFVAFSINDRISRMDRIRSNDSDERSNLITIYDLSRRFGKMSSERVRRKIDEYLMATLDYKIWDFYKTEKQFDALFSLVDKMKVKGKDKFSWEKMVERLSDVRLSRGETIELINERLSKFEWLVSVFLCLVILTCLILINPGTILMQILLGTLSVIIISVVFFLWTLDNLSWKAESKIFEPYAQTFESIGLLRYYPEDLVGTGRVKWHRGKKYRLGVFPKLYPDFSGKKIKIVKG